jgi:uncharacterized Rmd1/YagE family protein
MGEVLRSYGTSKRLQLGRVVQVSETNVLRRVAGAVALDYGGGRQLHAFDFGGMVLVGMNPADAAPVLALLQEGGGNTPENDDFILEDGEPIQVTFTSVRLPNRDPDLLRIVARVLAQSAALESLEKQVEDLLVGVEGVVQDLKQHGRIRRQETELVKFIGEVLHTRRNLVSNLAVLDKPEEAWDDQRAADLHTAMVRNFEIEERFKSLSEKLDLVQDSLEVITEVWRSRHSAFLEWLVIILISVELALALLEIVISKVLGH